MSASNQIQYSGTKRGLQLAPIVPKELAIRCLCPIINVTANDVCTKETNEGLFPLTLCADQLICVITVDLNGIVLQGLKFLASTKIFKDKEKKF